MLLVNMMTRWRAGTSVETESAESEKLLRGCGCGPTGGGGSFMESQVHHLWSCGFMCC